MSNSEILYQNKDFVLGIEWDEGTPYLHHDFYNWSPSIYKKFRDEVAKLEKYVKQKGCTEVWSYYDKTCVHLDKFCSKFNYVKVGETETQTIVLKEI